MMTSQHLAHALQLDPGHGLPRYSRLEAGQPIYYVVKRKQKIDRFGHSAIRNQVWNNLRLARLSAQQWADERHTTFIMASSSDKEHLGDGEFYLVAQTPETTYLPDIVKPHRKHFSIEAAHAERYRLSQLEPAKQFSVLCVVETFTAKEQA